MHNFQPHIIVLGFLRAAALASMRATPPDCGYQVLTGIHHNSTSLMTSQVVGAFPNRVAFMVKIAPIRVDRQSRLIDPSRFAISGA
jgi:hypothetical protein